jgi:hypothetical protein
MKHIIIIYITLMPFVLIGQEAGNSTRSTKEAISNPSNDHFNKIALSVVLPEYDEVLTPSQLSKIRSKVIRIAAKHGVSAEGYNHNFIIEAKLELYEEHVIQGLERMYSLDVEFFLQVKQVGNNKIFAANSINIMGIGSSKKSAFNNAIKKIPINNASYKQFIETAKRKILSHYESKCEDIISSALSSAATNNYLEAIGTLYSIPDDVSSCHSKLRTTLIEIYKSYQSHQCKSLLLKAQAYKSQKNYKEALRMIAFIDPTSSCFNTAISLAQEIESKVEIEERKKWDFRLKQYNNAVELEKIRIGAIVKIAQAYYSQEPDKTTILYNLIIR